MRPSDLTRRIEPGTLAVLDSLTRWDLTDVHTIRASYTAATARPKQPPHLKVRRVDCEIDGVPVRWYRPAGTGHDALPCLLWLHGGAYIMGNLDENDDRLDRVVLETGCTVVSVDYRLAPEHPFPAGLDDAQSVYWSIVGDPASYGVDGSRLIIGGASAGAGMAAGLCLRLREIDLPQPALQLLIYPMLDDREITGSIRAAADPGHWGLWQLRANRLCWQAYLGDLTDVPDAAAPARATDLSGLAPAFLSIGDVDAFLDENLAYAQTLSRDGVPVELHVYPGVIHGAFGHVPRTPQTRAMLDDIYRAITASCQL